MEVAVECGLEHLPTTFMVLHESSCRRMQAHATFEFKSGKAEPHDVRCGPSPKMILGSW